MGVIENLPLKSLVPVFITTFFLVFFLFTMVEPNLICTETGDSIMPECRVKSFSGDFILGLLIVGILFLLDMSLVYLMLGDYLL